MGGHNPKLVKRKVFPRKERKPHMHGCKGDGKVPCPKKVRVVCAGILSHTERCPDCSTKATERTLFGTPKSDFITG